MAPMESREEEEARILAELAGYRGVKPNTKDDSEYRNFRIRRLAEFGWKQTEIAELLEVTQATISRILKGSR